MTVQDRLPYSVYKTGLSWCLCVVLSTSVCLGKPNALYLRIQIHMRVATFSLTLQFPPNLPLGTSYTMTTTVAQSKATELTPPINISVSNGVLGSAV